MAAIDDLIAAAEGYAAFQGWSPPPTPQDIGPLPERPIPRPQLVVEVAFPTDPDSDAALSAYFTLNASKLGPDAGSGELAPEDVWADVTDDVLSATVDTGRSSELDEVAVGLATVTLENYEGQYNPENPDSPYYVGTSTVMPMRQIRIRAIWGDSSYTLFRGLIEGYDYQHGRNASVTVTAMDVLGVLAALTLTAVETGVWGSDTTGERIARLCDAIDLPASLRAISTGMVTMPATLLGQNALELAQAAQQAEIGYLLVDDGVLRFLDREAREDDPRSTEVQAVFADEGRVPEYEDLTTEYGVKDVFNVVSVTRSGDGAEPQVVQDIDSMGRYGKRTHDVSGLEVESDYEAQLHALDLLRRFREPAIRVTALRIEILNQPQHFGLVAGLRLGDRIQIQRSYESRDGVSPPYRFVQSLHIEGMAIEISADGWSFTFNTSRAPNEATLSPFILDTDHLNDGNRDLGL